MTNFSYSIRSYLIRIDINSRFLRILMRENVWDNLNTKYLLDILLFLIKAGFDTSMT